MTCAGLSHMNVYKIPVIYETNSGCRSRNFPFRQRSLPFLSHLENLRPVIDSVSIKKKKKTAAQGRTRTSNPNLSYPNLFTAQTLPHRPENFRKFITCYWQGSIKKKKKTTAQGRTRASNPGLEPGPRTRTFYILIFSPYKHYHTVKMATTGGGR